MKNFITGITLIFLSGVFPLIYLSVTTVELPERFFGFRTLYNFWFAIGNHLSLALLVIGVFFLINNLTSKKRKNIFYLAILAPTATSFLLVSWDLSPDQLPVSQTEYYGILIFIFFILVFLVRGVKKLLAKENASKKLKNLIANIEECSYKFSDIIDEIENIEAISVESNTTDNLRIWKSVLKDNVDNMYKKSDVFLRKLEKTTIYETEKP